MGHDKLKTVQNTCPKHMVWDHFREKSVFCPYWTLMTHLGTHLFRFQLAACCSLPGLGTGV